MSNLRLERQKVPFRSTSSIRLVVAALSLVGLNGCVSSAPDIAGPKISVLAYIETEIRADLSDAQSDAHEKEMAPVVEAQCKGPYETKVAIAINSLAVMGAFERVRGTEEVANRVAELDREFSACLHRYNLKGFMFASVEGSGSMSVPDLVRLTGQSSTSDATALSAGFAPRLVSVRPYIKRNGTSVAGHVRSAPNGTCIDNLRGCR